MGERMRWQDLGLAVLALGTAVLVALTYRGVTQLPATGTSTGQVAPRTDAGQVTTAAPQDAQGPTSTPPSEASRIRSVRTLLQQSDPLVVVALGDSTGNDTWEWPFEWARMLAGSRAVTVVGWGGGSESGYAAPLTLSEAPQADGPGPITLYVGHQEGAGVADAGEHLAELVPEQPDLVILNYGHNDAADQVEADLQESIAALREAYGSDLPVVLTLQPSGAGDAAAEVNAVVHDFAAEHALGWINVAAAFEKEAEGGAVLMLDEVHPNEAGQVLWARTVAKVLRAP